MIQFGFYIAARVGVFAALAAGCFVAGQMSADQYWASHMPYIAAAVGAVASILFHASATLLDPWQWRD